MGSRKIQLQSLVICAVLAVSLVIGESVHAQVQGRVVDLTLDGMVDLALSNSFRVRQLNMGVDRTRFRLQSQRARLRSRVDLNLSAPDLRSISETKWNSTLQRDEIIHEDSRRLEAELSIRQPVILFGYPTNGYLSLNNRVYRYAQTEPDGDKDLRYYNRYFIRYTQPFFQANSLKNNIEEAELDLEDTQLEFYEDVVEIVDDLSGDYFELFESSYQRIINEARVANLTDAVAAAEELALTDTVRAIDMGQVQVELANAVEQVQQMESQFRLQAASLTTTLNLSPSDSIILTPVIDVRPIEIDVEQATQFALQLTPRMRQLNINYRESEINLENTRSRGSFRMDLAMSYGREMQDPAFRELWDRASNTYTIDVNAYLPIWDWGQRSASIASSRIGLDQVQLRIEQAEQQIRSQVQNQVRSVEEFEARTLAMEGNLALANDLSASSIDLYREGSISALELIQSFQRESDTASNFLDAYLGWRRALLRVQQLTFYDFETMLPVLERFGIPMTDPNTDS